LSKAEREDPSLRMSSLVDTLAQDGVLDGALRIPNTAGDFGITADLCAQQLAASLQVDAPKDRGARGRVSWLVNQLREAPGTTAIESYPKNARTPIIASLSDARDSRDAAIGDDKREPVRFRVVLRVPMGTLRESGGKRPGFIDSVLALITSFYECVVQDINPWQPSAPKIKRSEPEPGDEEQSNSYLPATIPSPDSDGD
jgi:hypothetical protein